MQQMPQDPPLTALERELLTYVERLTTASEQSAIQFKSLEERSTRLLNNRLNDIEVSLTSLIASQGLLIEGLLTFARHSGTSASLPAELLESQRAIQAASQSLKQQG